MTDMPKAGFLCSGKTPLALSCSVHCAYKMMEILRTNGFLAGACHTEITEPVTGAVIKRAENTLEHLCKCCELVITVGCEGFSLSDIMPDITEAVCKKNASYFSSVLCGSRGISSAKGNSPERYYPGATEEACNRYPSRATAGICGSCLVLNFPGNTAYATELLNSLIPGIGFTVYNLSGKSARNSAELRNFLNSSLDFHEVFKKECIVNK